jgi:hypothetical protein
MATSVKIKWIASHPGFAYFVGDVCSMAPEMAQKLIKQGYVEEYIPQPAPDVPDLPHDFPARDALIAHGLLSLAECKQIKDFTEIKGIGKSMNKRILDYLKNLKK